MRERQRPDSEAVERDKKAAGEVSLAAVDILIPKAVSENPNVEIGISIGKEVIQAAALRSQKRQK